VAVEVKVDSSVVVADEEAVEICVDVAVDAWVVVADDDALAVTDDSNDVVAVDTAVEDAVDVAVMDCVVSCVVDCVLDWVLCTVFVTDEVAVDEAVVSSQFISCSSPYISIASFRSEVISSHLLETASALLSPLQ
jgi:hypothetical protein